MRRGRGHRAGEGGTILSFFHDLLRPYQRHARKCEMVEVSYQCHECPSLVRPLRTEPLSHNGALLLANRLPRLLLDLSRVCA